MKLTIRHANWAAETLLYTSIEGATLRINEHHQGAMDQFNRANCCHA